MTSRIPRPRFVCSNRRLITGLVASLVIVILAGMALVMPTTLTSTASPSVLPEPSAIESVVTGDPDDRSPAAGSRYLEPSEEDLAQVDTAISSVPPSDQLVHQIARESAGDDATPAEIQAASQALVSEWSSNHFHGPNPETHAALQQKEASRIKGPSPEADLAGRSVTDGLAQAEPVTMTILAIPVEFAGSDSVEDFSHEGIPLSGECITTTATFTGPMHNEILAPGPRDNNTLWMPSIEPDFFEKMVFSKEGITERVRMDLVDPRDGLPGIDISGQSMANYYAAMSEGRLRLDSGPLGVLDWVQVPHSVPYYGANRCVDGVVDGQSGFPDVDGNKQFVTDAVAAINARDPEFPWDEYDKNADGIVDNVQFFHAGMDASVGGGRFGTHQIWAHRRLPGYGLEVVVDDRDTPDDPEDDLLIDHYTMMGEVASLGVLAHEFGHNLGLGDYYTNGGTESAVWWDIMSMGSRAGLMHGSSPTILSGHSRYALGWLEPPVVALDEDPIEVLLGQASQPPDGTTSAVRVDLPDFIQTLVELPSGSESVWWSGDRHSWADLGMARELDLSAETGDEPIEIQFDLEYNLQANREFFFVEVSVDGGATYTQTVGLDAVTREVVTTPDDYEDPVGRLGFYGGLRYGYNGNADGWRRVAHELSEWAGQKIHVRLRYVSDAVATNPGAFVDNIAITAGSRILFEDPVEGGDLLGWDLTVGTWTNTTSEGWRQADGKHYFPRYYLLEWRNAVGFDEGLKYAYNTIYSGVTEEGRREFFVDRIPTNAPGLLVWLRDTRYGTDQFPDNNILTAARMRELPSEGPKGGLVLVDAHPEPLRGELGGRFENDFGSWPYPPDDDWNGGVQNVNAAFTLRDTPALTLSLPAPFDGSISDVASTLYGPQPGVSVFHDAWSYFPGVEALPEPVTTVSTTTRIHIKRYAFVDPDASTVVPASGYYPPRTPAGFTGIGAETIPPSDLISTNETMYLVSDLAPLRRWTGASGPSPARTLGLVNVGAAGSEEPLGYQSGQPGDYGVNFGFHFEVVDEADDGSTGTIKMWRAEFAAEGVGGLGISGDELISEASFRNIGGAATLVIYSDFDESSATYEEADSGEGGGVPVAATWDEIVEAVAVGGPDALAAFAVDPAEAVAVAFAEETATASTIGPVYALKPDAHASIIEVTNRVSRGTDVLATEHHTFRHQYLIHLPVLEGIE